MRTVSLLTILLAALASCTPTQQMTPTQTALAHTITTQYAAGVDALNAYCDVASTDPDIARICVPALSTINATEGTVQTAIGALVAVLAKRAIEETRKREAQMCGGVTR